MLRDSLVCKGGTALRKCYFGDYRFSEDLDFSALAGVPTGDEMEQLAKEACETAVRLLDDYAPVEISCERYTEREPHPGGQETFTIRARFPWQNRPQTRVMIEVTVNEKVLRPPEKRRVIHEYGEPLSAEVLVYSLEENRRRKAPGAPPAVDHVRGARLEPLARDYYGLWRVLTTYRDQMDLAGFDSLLREKCAVRGISFTGLDDFFHQRMLTFVEETWEQWLGPLVPDLPTFEIVINDLLPQVAQLVRPDGA